MKYINVVLGILLLGLLAACSSDDSVLEPGAPSADTSIDYTDVEKEVAREMAHFDYSFFKSVCKEGDGNVVISPLSMQMLLGMTALAVDEVSADEIVRGVGCADLEDLKSFHEGINCRAFEIFGCHKYGENKYVFRVWAPHAERVDLVGKFNGEREVCLKMDRLPDGESFEVVTSAQEGDVYAFLISTYDGRKIYKADPYAFYSDLPNSFYSKICDLPTKAIRVSWKVLISGHGEGIIRERTNINSVRSCTLTAAVR